MKQLSEFVLYSKIYYSHIGSKIFFLILLTFIIGSLDILGITLLIPVLEFFLQQDSNNGDSQIHKYINLIINKDLQNNETYLAIFVISTFIFKGIITIISYSAVALILSTWLANFRKKFYRLVTEVDYQYFMTKDTGYFINLSNEQINLSVSSINNYIKLISQLINTLMYLCVVFFMAWEAAFLALLGGLFLQLIFRPINSRIVHLSKTKAGVTGILSQSLIQVYQSYKYLFSTGVLKKLEKNLNKQINELSALTFRQNVLSAIIMGVKEPFTLIVIFTLMFIQLSFFDSSAPLVLASLLLFYRTLNSVLGVQMGWQSTLATVGSLILIDEEVSSLKQKAVLPSNKQLISKSFEISFSEVDFKFRQASEPVLNKISFQLKENKSLAIVGTSGSGKSTILNLVTNLLKPTNGIISIGGNDLQKTNMQVLRSKVGYVSQESCIFDASIACNIHMWDEDVNEITRQKKVEVAAQKAGLIEFINNLPNKFETFVGDRGSRLSGGQRQRICVARELYKQPKILILDEATSALDERVMEEVNKNILSLRDQLTIIFVTHQFSILNAVDEILVLENGQIGDRGSLEDLRARKNSYILQNHVDNQIPKEHI